MVQLQRATEHCSEVVRIAVSESSVHSHGHDPFDDPHQGTAHRWSKKIQQAEAEVQKWYRRFTEADEKLTAAQEQLDTSYDSYYLKLLHKEALIDAERKKIEEQEEARRRIQESERAEEEKAREQYRTMSLTDFLHKVIKDPSLLGQNARAVQVVGYISKVQAKFRSSVTRRRYKAMRRFAVRAETSRLAHSLAQWKLFTTSEVAYRRTLLRRAFRPLQANANVASLRRTKVALLLDRCRAKSTLQRCLEMWYRYTIYINTPVDPETKRRECHFAMQMDPWDEFLREEDKRIKLQRTSSAMAHADPYLIKAHYMARWWKLVLHRREKREKNIKALAHYMSSTVRRHFFAWANHVTLAAQKEATEFATKQYYIARWKVAVARWRRERRCTNAMKPMRKLSILTKWRKETVELRRNQSAAMLTLQGDKCLALLSLCVIAGNGLEGTAIKIWRNWRFLVRRRKAWMAFTAARWHRRLPQLKTVCWRAWRQYVQQQRQNLGSSMSINEDTMSRTPTLISPTVSAADKSSRSMRRRGTSYAHRIDHGAPLELCTPETAFELWEEQKMLKQRIAANSVMAEIHRLDELIEHSDLTLSQNFGSDENGSAEVSPREDPPARSPAMAKPPVAAKSAGGLLSSENIYAKEIPMRRLEDIQFEDQSIRQQFGEWKAFHYAPYTDKALLVNICQLMFVLYKRRKLEKQKQQQETQQQHQQLLTGAVSPSVGAGGQNGADASSTAGAPGSTTESGQPAELSPLELRRLSNAMTTMCVGFPLYASNKLELNVAEVERAVREEGSWNTLIRVKRAKRHGRQLRRFEARLSAQRFFDVCPFFVCAPAESRQPGFSPFHFIIEEYNYIMEQRAAAEKAKSKKDRGFGRHGNQVAQPTSRPKYTIPLPEVPKKRQLPFLLRLHLQEIVGTHGQKAIAERNAMRLRIARAIRQTKLAKLHLSMRRANDFSDETQKRIALVQKLAVRETRSLRFDLLARRYHNQVPSNCLTMEEPMGQYDLLNLLGFNPQFLRGAIQLEIRKQRKLRAELNAHAKLLEDTGFGDNRLLRRCNSDVGGTDVLQGIKEKNELLREIGPRRHTMPEAKTSNIWDLIGEEWEQAQSEGAGSQAGADKRLGDGGDGVLDRTAREDEIHQLIDGEDIGMIRQVQSMYSMLNSRGTSPHSHGGDDVASDIANGGLFTDDAGNIIASFALSDGLNSSQHGGSVRSMISPTGSQFGPVGTGTPMHGNQGQDGDRRRSSTTADDDDIRSNVSNPELLMKAGERSPGSAATNYLAKGQVSNSFTNRSRSGSRIGSRQGSLPSSAQHSVETSYLDDSDHADTPVHNRSPHTKSNLMEKGSAFKQQLDSHSRPQTRAKTGIRDRTAKGKKSPSVKAHMTPRTPGGISNSSGLGSPASLDLNRNMDDAEAEFDEDGRPRRAIDPTKGGKIDRVAALDGPTVKLRVALESKEERMMRRERERALREARSAKIKPVEPRQLRSVARLWQEDADEGSVSAIERLLEISTRYSALLRSDVQADIRDLKDRILALEQNQLHGKHKADVPSGDSAAKEQLKRLARTVHDAIGDHVDYGVTPPTSPQVNEGMDSPMRRQRADRGPLYSAPTQPTFPYSKKEPLYMRASTAFEVGGSSPRERSERRVRSPLYAKRAPSAEVPSSAKPVIVEDEPVRRQLLRVPYNFTTGTDAEQTHDRMISTAALINELKDLSLLEKSSIEKPPKARELLRKHHQDRLPTTQRERPWRESRANEPTRPSTSQELLRQSAKLTSKQSKAQQELQKQMEARAAKAHLAQVRAKKEAEARTKREQEEEAKVYSEFDRWLQKKKDEMRLKYTYAAANEQVQAEHDLIHSQIRRAHAQLEEASSATEKAHERERMRLLHIKLDQVKEALDVRPLIDPNNALDASIERRSFTPSGTGRPAVLQLRRSSASADFRVKKQPSQPLNDVEVGQLISYIVHTQHV